MLGEPVFPQRPVAAFHRRRVGHALNGAGHHARIGKLLEVDVFGDDIGIEVVGQHSPEAEKSAAMLVQLRTRIAITRDDLLRDARRRVDA